MSADNPDSPEVPDPHTSSHTLRPTTRAEMAGVTLGALGVVYGDIGTSPLYAIKECFGEHHGLAPTPENVLGILSLVFWALTLVIVVKYLSFIMRADNQGEGGILALLALCVPRGADRPRGARAIPILLGLFGASLLYGEGAITPVISVLGAIEGLTVATTVFNPFVVPATVVILIALFLIQKRGTASVGAIFGPTMLVWFITIAAIGLPWILREPRVLQALSPHHAALFFLHHKLHGFLALGAVVLCITGAEALYADMGHFGKRPIRLAWFAVVFPALLVNYFGQGALLLHHAQGPKDVLARVIANPFYGLVSGLALYPLVIIATMAAVIASQALISGAYSLTRQGVQLGYLPRMNIVHTSGEAEGQIYVPEVNRMLMLACVALTLTFQSSSRVAAAYGIAVTGTMVITSILFNQVARHRWGWSPLRAGVVLGCFLLVDVAFFSANLAKIADGGWVPVVLATGLYTLMTTWKAGRMALERFMRQATLPIDLFLDDLARRKPPRVKGTAVFMTSNPDGAPVVLLHHFKHNKMFHEHVVLLSVITERVPEVRPTERVQLRELSEGFFQVTARYGFIQTPNVPEIMRACRGLGLVAHPSETSYYLGRETLLTTGKSGLSQWRMSLFTFLSRNARPATAFFGIPPNRVIELGAQIEL